MPRPTLRSLARQLELSPATISLALRDSPRIHAETRALVVQAARRAGYQSNPLVRSMMSALRRASQDSYHGALLAINYSSEESPSFIGYHREVLAGAKERASELGYSLEHCWVGPTTLTLKRLNSMLHARIIHGRVVMPFAGTQDFSSINWRGIAAVVMDYCLSTPVLHSVLPDHHLTLLHAMEQLRASGYKRPGLVLEAKRDARLKYKWSAGFTSSFRDQDATAPIPLMLSHEITAESFLEWFRQCRPDVIIGHLQREVTQWLRRIGVQVPRDVGFLQLNWTERSAPCAGIDQQPRLLGATAVEAVVAQLIRDERGIPAHPKTITLEGTFRKGPTLADV